MQKIWFFICVVGIAVYVYFSTQYGLSIQNTLENGREMFVGMIIMAVGWWGVTIVELKKPKVSV